MVPTADEFRSPVDLATRVADLEAENAELRERIADLEERAVGPLGTPVGRKPAKRTTTNKR